MSAAPPRARRLLPHPLLSALLLVCWLWLNNSVEPGHVVLGALLAVGIPLFTRRFWPDPIAVRHPLRVLEYAAIVLYDIVVANLEVAALILGPRSRLVVAARLGSTRLIDTISVSSAYPAKDATA